MEWVLLVLLRACFVSGKDICFKLGQAKSTASVTLTAIHTAVVAGPPLLLYVLWDGSWTSIQNPVFLGAVAGNVLFNVFGYITFIVAIRKFDVSYVSAIMGTSPVIFGVFSILFVGENPGLTVFMYMSVIVLGAVLVEISRGKIKSLRAFALESGWLLVFLFLGFAGMATVFSKTAVMNGDPEAYIAFRYTSLFLVFLAIHFLYESTKVRQWLKRKKARVALKFDKTLALAGLFMLGGVLCEMNALQLTDMARVEAISKLAIVLTLLIDGKFMSKHNSWQRWVGSLLIILGGVGVALN